MKLVTAKKLWDSGSFVGNCTAAFPVNCDKIAGSSPRYAWLVPVGGCCGATGDYQLTMSNPNPAATDGASDILNANAGILKGIWVETEGGKGALYDVLNPQEIIDACNACCDAEGAAVEIAARYDNTFPAVADIEPTTFTITRADNGTAYDLQRARLDYLGQHIEGTFNRTAYAGGNSTYTFQARGDAHKIGADTVVETARTFDSNSVAAGGAGNHYAVTAVLNGTTLPLFEDDAYNAVSDLVTALNADATWNAYGTWSAASASVLRLTSTVVTTATITLSNPAD